jgi:peptide deformylase
MFVCPPNLHLIYYPDPLLNQCSEFVEEFNNELDAFVSSMIYIMRSHNGLGLSAIQVGISLRIMVMDIGNNQVEVLCNPVIKRAISPKNGNEACLSLPEIVSEVVRPSIIDVEFTNTAGNTFTETFKGIYARCISHEIDHMNGQLFIDKISAFKRFYLKKQLQQLKDKYEYDKTQKI